MFRPCIEFAEDHDLFCDECVYPITITLTLKGRTFDLEGEWKFDKAKRLYWQIIDGDFEGSFSYERLRAPLIVLA